MAAALILGGVAVAGGVAAAAAVASREPEPAKTARGAFVPPAVRGLGSYRDSTTALALTSRTFATVRATPAARGAGAMLFAHAYAPVWEQVPGLADPHAERTNADLAVADIADGLAVPLLMGRNDLARLSSDEQATLAWDFLAAVAVIQARVKGGLTSSGESPDRPTYREALRAIRRTDLLTAFESGFGRASVLDRRVVPAQRAARDVCLAAGRRLQGSLARLGHINLAREGDDWFSAREAQIAQAVESSGIFNVADSARKWLKGVASIASIVSSVAVGLVGGPLGAATAVPGLSAVLALVRNRVSTFSSGLNTDAQNAFAAIRTAAFGFEDEYRGRAEELLAGLANDPTTRNDLAHAESLVGDGADIVRSSLGVPNDDRFTRAKRLLEGTQT